MVASAARKPLKPVKPASALPPGVADTPSFSPLYQQIAARLVKSLQQGEWLPGQAIPSEMELAARYQVSQGTVRKAIDAMASGNLLVRRQGKGTFVATHAEAATQYRFLRLMPDAAFGSAQQVPLLQRRLLDCRRQRAPADVARMLALKTGDAAIQVRRLLLVEQQPGSALQPLVLDDLWLPGTLFKGLTADRLSAWRGPMYRQFELEFSVTMVRAEEKLRAVAATAANAKLLGVATGSPLLSVERLAYSYGNQPVEWRRGLYHTQHHHYRNELG
jgi:GntR family transcriptional regulator